MISHNVASLCKYTVNEVIELNEVKLIQAAIQQQQQQHKLMLIHWKLRVYNIGNLNA